MSYSKLLLATGNQAKIREYRALLSGLPARSVTLKEEGIEDDASEEGDSFGENAIAKATHYARRTGLLTMADDSGLEVARLGGAPGVRSRRYVGEEATDEERIKSLLAALDAVPEGERQARFRCAIAIAEPDGLVHLCHGTCEGTVAFQSRGTGGFGYDPIFFLPHLGRTMAELSLEEKNQISHRAQAARRVYPILRALLSVGA
ncbi:MAG: RdgB/HAM1 family non-canonical purine NTP pyrophosphatase [Chloroflexi bacterium]|nr:RdgB/HAM1 family non-canonical purine NTP pyrophosphatase [Chloroflexota bacterium]